VKRQKAFHIRLALCFGRTAANVGGTTRCRKRRSNGTDVSGLRSAHYDGAQHTFCPPSGGGRGWLKRRSATASLRPRTGKKLRNSKSPPTPKAERQLICLSFTYFPQLRSRWSLQDVFDRRIALVGWVSNKEYSTGAERGADMRKK
jgi:hypothetical protein